MHTATAATTPAATPAAVKPLRLPLYLVGRKPACVKADGPALLVSAKGESPRRYPLSRLARVLSGPRNEWHPSALSICQQNGLPIVFLDTAGQVSGYLQPAQPRPSTLHGVIAETLNRGKWRLPYQNWLRAERMRLVHGWRQAREQAGRPVDERQYRELIRACVYQPGARDTLSGWKPYFQGALAAYVNQALHQAGLSTCYWGEDARPLNLADDLTHLSCLSLRLDMHGLGEAAHGEPAAMLRVLHAFGASITQRLTGWLGSLHRNLRTRLEEWH